MGPDILPTKLTISEANQTFDLDWEDGHHSSYPWWYLRGLCPCAACQGHGGDSRFVPTVQVRLGDVDEVGNYALRLAWSDNHKTGIYSFVYLRHLCACPACRHAAGLAHPVHLLPPELRPEASA